MTKALRLGTDPLGRMGVPEASRPGPDTLADDPLERILSDSGPRPQAPPAPAGTAVRDTDAAARGLDFLNDMIDGADIPLRRRPLVTVDMDSDLAELSMRDAYLLGHALRLILDMGRESPEPDHGGAPLRVHLSGRLSGRLELSVTDDGNFFPGDLGVVAPSTPEVRELTDFVSRRGGSVLLARYRATRVSVVVWGRQGAVSPPRVLDGPREAAFEKRS